MNAANAAQDARRSALYDLANSARRRLALVELCRAAREQQDAIARDELLGDHLRAVFDEAIECHLLEALPLCSGIHQLTPAGVLVAEIGAPPETRDPRPEIVPPAAPVDFVDAIARRLTGSPNYGDRLSITVDARRDPADSSARQWRARATSDGRRWCSSWCERRSDAEEELYSMLPEGPPKL